MKSGKYTIDRFEGELAVLLLREDETVEVFKNRSELPKGANEGDILSLEFDSDKLVTVNILNEETYQARKSAQDLLNRLKNK